MLCALFVEMRVCVGIARNLEARRERGPHIFFEFFRRNVEHPRERSVVGG
jgi:hypothetical protein